MAERKLKLYKDLVVWYMLINFTMVFLLMATNYNHPEFGFFGEGYGLGTLLTVLFPIIWLMIYVFTQYIQSKNKEIAELQGKIESPISKEGSG